MSNLEDNARTQLLLGDIAEHADWPMFYESQLALDYSYVLDTQTMAPPASALAEQVSAALAGGRTQALAHWADTAHRSGLASVGPLDALVQQPGAGLSSRARRIIAAHAVLLSLSGVALVYLRDVLALAALTTPTLSQIRHALADPQSLTKRVYEGVTRLVRARQGHAAFAPRAPQQGLTLTEGVWSVVRTAPAMDPSPLALQSGRVVCLTNLSAEEQLISVDWRAVLGTRNAVRDLLTGTRFNVHGPSLALQAYQVMWVTV